MSPRHFSRNPARGHLPGGNGTSHELAGPAPPNGASRDPIEIAQYVGQLTAELSRMAADAKLDFLVYLLNMAHAESQLISRRAPDGAVGADK